MNLPTIILLLLTLNAPAPHGLMAPPPLSYTLNALSPNHSDE